MIKGKSEARHSRSNHTKHLSTSCSGAGAQNRVPKGKLILVAARDSPRPVIPAPLSGPQLEMGCNSVDILHATFYSGARFGTIAVHWYMLVSFRLIHIYIQKTALQGERRLVVTHVLVVETWFCPRIPYFGARP